MDHPAVASSRCWLLAPALMGKPRMLLIDEPCEGLAPIIVAQNAHFALCIADRGYVTDKGTAATRTVPKNWRR